MKLVIVILMCCILLIVGGCAAPQIYQGYTGKAKSTIEVGALVMSMRYSDGCIWGDFASIYKNEKEVNYPALWAG